MCFASLGWIPNRGTTRSYVSLCLSFNKVPDCLQSTVPSYLPSGTVTPLCDEDSSKGCELQFLHGLICVSLSVNEAEPLSVWFFAIHMSSLAKYLFKSFAHLLKINVSIFEEL